MSTTAFAQSQEKQFDTGEDSNTQLSSTVEALPDNATAAGKSRSWERYTLPTVRDLRRVFEKNRGGMECSEERVAKTAREIHKSSVEPLPSSVSALPPLPSSSPSTEEMPAAAAASTMPQSVNARVRWMSPDRVARRAQNPRNYDARWISRRPSMARPLPLSLSNPTALRERQSMEGMDHRVDAVNGAYVDVLKRLHVARFNCKFEEMRGLRGEEPNEKELAEEQKKETNAFDGKLSYAIMKATDGFINDAALMQWLKEESETMEEEMKWEVERGKTMREERKKKMEGRQSLWGRASLARIPSSSRPSICSGSFLPRQSMRRMSIVPEPFRVLPLTGGTVAETNVDECRDERSRDEYRVNGRAEEEMSETQQRLESSPALDRSSPPSAASNGNQEISLDTAPPMDTVSLPETTVPEDSVHVP